MNHNKTLPLCDALVSVLGDIDARYLFGVSGANIEHVHDAVVRLTEPHLSSVLCKSEFAAAFSANAYARHTSSLGVCCATSGGGMMNLAVGIAEAQAAHVPVLAIVGCPPSALQNQGAFQDAQGGINQVDAQGLWSALTKYSALVTVENFWQVLHTAITQAINITAGPSALLIPRDIMTHMVPARPSNWPCELSGFRQATTFNQEQYAIFANDLKQAQRPVLVAGGRLFNSQHLDKCAELFSIPVVCTLESTGVLAHDHPQFAGMLGVAGHSSTHDLVAQSDLLIVCGATLNFMDRAPVEASLQGKNIWIVNDYLDTLPAFSNIKTLRMDADQFLKNLICDQTLKGLDFTALEIPPIVYFTQPQAVELNHKSETKGLILSKCFRLIQKHLHHFNTILFDAGNCAAAAAHYLRIPAHSNSYVALGMAGMGYAVCAAVGAQLANLENSSSAKSLVVCGDGAFLIGGSELNTAIDKQLNILWVICNDSQHGMCTSRQRVLFESRISATRYPPVHFANMARAFSSADKLWVARATKYADIEIALTEYCALDTPRPGVLEIVSSQDEIPPFTPISKMQE